MAVTRIKNNQITDASNGNTQLGVNAAVKLQNYTITSTKIANNLVYGSDLTITGNLTVQGNTTTIDTTITTIEDPVIQLASTQTTGTPTVDIGFVGPRGNLANIAFVWDESGDEFVTAFTSTGETNTTVTITSYADFHTNNANIGGNIVINGDASVVGNITGAITFTGNITAGNLLTSGLVSATGNVTGGNVNTAGAVSATGNVTGGNVNTAGAVSATGAITSAANISGANILTTGLISATGDVTGGNVNTAGNVSATGNITANFFIGNGSQLTGVTASSVDANLLTGNTLSSNVLFSSLTSVGTLTSLSVSGTTTTGNLDTAGTVSATGNITGDNITGGNLLTGGIISAAGTITSATTITGGNLATGGTVSATGTATVGNLATGGTVSATGNVTGGNVNTAGLISATGNVTGGNVLFGSGIVTGTGNIYGGNIIATDAFFGNIDLTGDITVNSLTANTFVSATGNVTGGNINTGGIISATSTVIAGNVATGGTVSATGNITGGNLLTGGVISATGTITSANTITGGNLSTSGTVSATGNITGGNLLTSGLISAAGLATSGNVETAGYVSATGNVYGGNVVTNFITNTSGDVSISAAADLVLEPTGNIVLDGGKYINQLLDPVQAQDAATKQYVDDAVSSGIHIHTPVLVESPTALNGTYAQGGTTATVTNTIAGNTVVFSTAVNLQPNDQLWFSNSFQGITANTAYFVVSAPNTSSAILSDAYSGAPVTDITSATGLTEAVRINSGVGATLTNAGANATLVIDGVTLSNTNRVLIYTQANAVHNGVYVVSEAGNATTAWQLTRSTDADTYIPDDSLGIDEGSYFFVQSGDTGAGESYVMTSPQGPFVIGFASLTFTQFSASQVYTANTNAGLSLIGTVFSAKVDNNTTAFDLAGNISVKAGANLTTPNIGDATGVTLSLTGNVTSGNVVTGGFVTATGNVAGGNINTGGLISATGNVTGNFFIGNGSQLTGVTASSVDANALTGNTLSSNVTFSSLTSVGDLSSLSVVGTATVGNVNTAGIVSATGNITGGNITTAGLISATGTITSADTITGGNLATGGTVSATGTATLGNVDTGGTVSATGNVTGGNVLTTGIISSTGTATLGNVDTGGTVSATGNVTGGNVLTTGIISSTGTATLGNVATGGTVSATGNVTGGNVLTTGIISSTGTATLGNVATGGTVSATGNVTGGNLLFGSGVVSGTGNIFADTIFANISGNIDAAGANTQVQFNDGDLLGASAGFTFDKVGNVLTANGNITGANLFTGGTVSATGNVTGGNILTGGLISATGKLDVGGQITSTGAGNAATNGGQIFLNGATNNRIDWNTNGLGAPEYTTRSAGAKVVLFPSIGGSSTDYALGVEAGALWSGIPGNDGGQFFKWYGGNVPVASLSGTGVFSATGNVTGANLILTTGIIDGPAAGRITINGSDIDTDFAVDGDTVANVFYVDAGTGTASFGSSSQVTNAIVNFDVTTSIKAPVGNTAQRPATGVTGMVRFNTTNNALEVYDNSAWSSVGVPVFTVIADEQFNGDGSTVVFTLATSQTTNSCIVSINGVVQIPTLAYSVSGTTLTFTEAPLGGDLIDVRQITTTTTVTSIANSSGNAVVAVSPTSAQVNVTGDLSVSGSILGGNINSTAITNGTSNVSVVSSGGNVTTSVGGTSNVVVVSSTDVTITGNLTVTGNATLSGNILGDRIQNGTTIIDIQSAGGNANITIGGTPNTAVFSNTALTLATPLLPSANITYDLGSTTQRWKDLWLSNSTIYLGNSQISANATALIFTNPAGGQTVLAGASAGITGATVSASGNITGGNITTGGVISATGSITGASVVGGVMTGSSVSVTGAVTGASVVGGVMTGSSVSVTGAVTGASVVGGVMTGSSVSVTGAVTGASVVGGVMTGSSLSVTGAVTGAGLTGTSLTVSTGTVTCGNIVNSNANGIGNIGSTGTRFNQVFALASSAQYADLAEKYTADADYAPGTVVIFGGTAEVTVDAQDADRRVAGVVSTNPAYIMNDTLESTYIATVALTGRVPCLVTGPVRKGDLMVAAGLGRARAEADPRVGTVIGKALEDFEGESGTIEVVVGRF